MCFSSHLPKYFCNGFEIQGFGVGTYSSITYRSSWQCLFSLRFVNTAALYSERYLLQGRLQGFCGVRTPTPRPHLWVAAVLTPALGLLVY